MRAARSALVLALGALALAGCSDDTARKPAPAPDGPRLVLAPSETADWQEVPAAIDTVNEAQLLARIPGILSTLSVRAGDAVRKGQVIGRITDSQLGYQAGAYGAQAAAAKAQAGAARADLARVRFLYQNGVYAKARLDQAEASAGAAEAQIGAAMAQKSAIDAMAGQGALVAPAAGRVLRADIPAGSPVTPGMVVAVITSGATVLRLTMPETLAGTVHVGTPVEARLPDGRAVTGAVGKLYPDVQSGRFTADAPIPGLADGLIGQRLAARVATGRRRALVVPAKFVTTRYGIDYVTLLARDGSAGEVPVQTAPASPGTIEILSGAAAGDTLIGPVP
ncbi:MAG: efflux RND transporter periplasmic adaptor subunit [Sphingomonadales bacterium]|nr:efflux RND transporter periplasmic adaptor subunit [Sphingomonadales bacterium]